MEPIQINMILAYVWVWRVSNATSKLYVSGKISLEQYRNIRSHCMETREPALETMDPDTYLLASKLSDELECTR